MPQCTMALDKLVDFLAGEDEYWQRITLTPHLWDAKKKKVTAAKERHLKARRRVSHYVQRGTDPDRAGNSQGINVASLLEDFETSRSEANNDDDITDLTEISPSKSQQKSQHMPPVVSTAAKSSRFSQCPTCQRIKVPAECSLQLCKSCCIKLLERCMMQYHQREKVGTRGAYIPMTATTKVILKVVEEAVSSRRELWISYMEGTMAKNRAGLLPWKL